MSSPCLRVNPDREIVATIVLRRPPGTELAIAAKPEDVGTIRRFVTEQGMHVVCEDAAARTVRIEGAIRQMETAFGVTMQQRRDDAGYEYLYHDGEVTLPQPLTTIVEAVLGLDRRPVARSHAHA